ncbi:MAG TPA: hypothetical protein VK923_19485, partial [Euzebyales bacterium]|nr:hypothetical protein [Euzebyales bacterium]
MSDTTTRTQSSNGASTDVVADALKDAGERLLNLVVERAAQMATEQVEGLSDRLTEYAENGGSGLMA